MEKKKSVEKIAQIKEKEKKWQKTKINIFSWAKRKVLNVTRVVKLKRRPNIAYVLCASKGFEKVFLKEFYDVSCFTKFSEPLLNSFLSFFYPLPPSLITTYIEKLLILGSAFCVVKICTKGIAYVVWLFQWK